MTAAAADPPTAAAMASDSDRQRQETAATQQQQQQTLQLTEADLSDIAGLKVVPYNSEQQLPAMAALIAKDLSEPYSVYTYRYFLLEWPQLCLNVRHTFAAVAPARADHLTALDCVPRRFGAGDGRRGLRRRHYWPHRHARRPEARLHWYAGRGGVLPKARHR